jgi:hypothetical protein
MKYFILVLVAFMFSCKQNAYDYSKTTIDPNNLNVRIQKSQSVVDTMADLPLQFSVQSANVDKYKYCSYTTNNCGSIRLDAALNAQLAVGDTIKTQKLSRFADFETRGFLREEVIKSVMSENVAGGTILHVSSEASYPSFNYNDELLQQDHFFSNLVNESFNYDQYTKVAAVTELKTSKGDTLQREFLLAERDPRNDSFVHLKCEVRQARKFEKYDFGTFKLESSDIQSLLKNQINKGGVYCGPPQELILIGQGTQTIQEVSTANGKTILVGTGQVLYRNEDIILDNGKRILSSTFKVNDLPK